MIDKNIHELSQTRIRENPENTYWEDKVREHVKDCTPCTRALDTSLKLRTMIRGSRMAAVHPSTSLQVSIAAMLAQEAGSSAPAAIVPITPRWMKWALPVAMAACLVLGFGLGNLGHRVPDFALHTNMAGLLDDVTHDAFLLELADDGAEFVSSDAQETSRWVKSRVGLDVALNSSSGGWNLEGARMWHTIGRISALSYYAHSSGRRIHLFTATVEGVDTDDTQSAALRSGEYYVLEAYDRMGIAWIEDGMMWAAVGHLTADELRAWSEGYRSSLRAEH